MILGSPGQSRAGGLNIIPSVLKREKKVESYYRSYDPEARAGFATAGGGGGCGESRGWLAPSTAGEHGPALTGGSPRTGREHVCAAPKHISRGLGR